MSLFLNMLCRLVITFIPRSKHLLISWLQSLSAVILEPPQKSLTAAAAAKSLQSCPTLCDPMDGSLPGSPVPGILQARTLEWVAISFSKEWKEKVQVKSLSCVRLFASPWTVAHQAPLPWDFPGENTGVGCHFLLQGIFSTQGFKLCLLCLLHCQVGVLVFF